VARKAKGEKLRAENLPAGEERAGAVAGAQWGPPGRATLSRLGPTRRTASCPAALPFPCQQTRSVTATQENLDLSTPITLATCPHFCPFPHHNVENGTLGPKLISAKFSPDMADEDGTGNLQYQEFARKFAAYKASHSLHRHADFRKVNKS
jgi:hypothetical protein